jgi:hypothetical protein
VGAPRTVSRLGTNFVRFTVFALVLQGLARHHGGVPHQDGESHEREGTPRQPPLPGQEQRRRSGERDPHAGAAVDKGVGPVLKAGPDRTRDGLSHRRRSEPRTAAGHQYPQSQDPRRGGARHDGHTRDRNHASGNRHQARSRPRRVDQRDDDRDAVTDVGTRADQPKQGRGKIESLAHLRQIETVSETGQPVGDRDQGQPRRHQPSDRLPTPHVHRTLRTTHQRPFFPPGGSGSAHPTSAVHDPHPGEPVSHTSSPWSSFRPARTRVLRRCHDPPQAQTQATTP